MKEKKIHKQVRIPYQRKEHVARCGVLRAAGCRLRLKEAGGDGEGGQERRGDAVAVEVLGSVADLGLILGLWRPDTMRWRPITTSNTSHFSEFSKEMTFKQRKKQKNAKRKWEFCV